MNRKKYLYIGLLLFIFMVIFIITGILHPEFSFPISIKFTYILYLGYISTMICIFFTYLKKNK